MAMFFCSIAAHAALREQPFEHEARDVDRVGRRRVDHRIRGRLLLPVKRRRRDRQRAIEEIAADDHERETRRADVLLRAAVDHAVLRDVDDARQDVRRHVGDQRNPARVRRPLVFDAADGLVRADVHVRRIVRELPRRLRRHVGEVLVLRRRRDVDRAVLLRFLDRFLRPLAGVDVVGDFPLAKEVHRDDRVLGNRAALQEQHLVVGGDREQRAQVGLRLRGDADELLAAMAHLHHRHPGAVPVEHFGGGLLEDGFGKHRGSGAEIEHSHGTGPGWVSGIRRRPGATVAAVGRRGQSTGIEKTR